MAITITGIYKITNTGNGKCYIGSSVNIRARFATHISWLKNNRHDNYILQKDWNRYGKDFFIFEILLYCDRRNLLFFEQKALNITKALESRHGYNFTSATIGTPHGSNFEKIRRKISEIHKGKTISKEQKQQISEFQIGRKTSEKTKRKMSEASINSKAVIINGKYYPAIAIAGRNLKISRATVRKKIKTNKPGYTWA